MKAIPVTTTAAGALREFETVQLDMMLEKKAAEAVRVAGILRQKEIYDSHFAEVERTYERLWKRCSKTGSGHKIGQVPMGNDKITGCVYCGAPKEASDREQILKQHTNKILKDAVESGDLADADIWRGEKVA